LVLFLFCFVLFCFLGLWILWRELEDHCKLRFGVVFFFVVVVVVVVVVMGGEMGLVVC
jgi:hypothetical protein